MKKIGDKIECLQGERFSQLMTGFDFVNASQILILLYKQTDSSVSLAFVKVASESYPAAGLITLNQDSKMVFNIDTTNLATGKYDIEVRVDFVGVAAPIVKDIVEFLEIKPSRT
jgi:hypothetical protein